MGINFQNALVDKLKAGLIDYFGSLDAVRVEHSANVDEYYSHELVFLVIWQM